MGGLCSSDDPGTSATQGANQGTGAAKKKREKLLLLGAGGSGKSTIFKQMKTIFGDGYSLDERKTLRYTVFQNLINSMKVMCEQSKNFPNKYGTLKKENIERRKKIMDLDELEEVTVDETLGTIIKELWADGVMKKIFAHRSEYFLAIDTIDYFFNKIDDIMKGDYVPSQEDVLHCRWVSTGVKKETFSISDIPCVLLDVGGQRSERKKWEQCFEDVSVVIYVVAISEYDQVLYEDDSQNRVREALDLFEDICNSEWFAETPIVLFLNKEDLFNQKITQVPLDSVTEFKEYKPYDETKDESQAEAARRYIQSEFENRNQQVRDVATMTTCATNTKKMKKVVDDTIGKILREKSSNKT